MATSNVIPFRRPVAPPQPKKILWADLNPELISKYAYMMVADGCFEELFTMLYWLRADGPLMQPKDGFRHMITKNRTSAADLCAKTMNAHTREV